MALENIWKNFAGMGPVQSIARRLDRSLRSPVRLEARTPEGEIRALKPAEIGVRGEKLAALHLQRVERMKVLYRNFRAPEGGEVDLICRDRDVLAFVEVKTRTTEAYGRPSDAVNKHKQALIARGATHWLRMLDHPDIYFRFDVMEVVLEEGELPRFNLIREAFQLPDWSRY